MRLATVEPIWLRSPKDDFQRKDRNNTGSSEVNESNSTVCLTSGRMKKTFKMDHCADKFIFSSCQNVSGILCEVTATSGRSR